MKKIKYKIKGIDCPNCALKIQNHIATNKEVESCNLDFLNEKLTVVYKNSELENEQLLSLIKEIENEDITITKFENDNRSSGKTKIITKPIMILIGRIVLSLIILLINIFVISPLSKKSYDVVWWISFTLYIIDYLLISYDFLIKFFKGFKSIKTIFNENTLMVVASIGAFCILEFNEAILVIMLSQVGNIFEEISLIKSKNIIVNTIDMRSKTASKILSNGGIQEISCDDIKEGDLLKIKIGEVLPVDGIVKEGKGTIDQSSLTGEFVPVLVNENDVVYSGTILKDGSLSIEATSTFTNSKTSQILNMVLESGEHKAKAESFINKFAKIYTPIVCLLALIIAIFPPLFTCLFTNVWAWSTWSNYLYTALTFLVISCPCAIVISVPLSYFSGVALGAKNGIIIKGGNYLDRLNELSTVVFDKTGTLTTGQFSLVGEKISEEISKEEFYNYIVMGESLSSHPIAKAVVSLLKNSVNVANVKSFNEIQGHGVEYTYLGKEIKIVNESYLKQHNIDFVSAEYNLLNIYLVIDNKCYGYISLDDTIKEGSYKTIEYLNNHDINTVMLTGAKKESALFTADKINLKSVKYELLPEEKLSSLKEVIDNNKGATGYVGDGVNDAPSIVLSDVGVAMGSLGSDSVVDNADIVIMNDDPYKLVSAIKIAKKTRFKAISSIVFALSIKVIIMVLSLIPFIKLPMWVAVLCDTGLSLVLTIYVLLLLVKKIK
ncbi:MAG: heavy metal translocating P-type ATPase [Bacilli bacterium]